MGVQHQPKAGATLTGTEYEAADHHVVDLDAADVGAAAADHDHDADYSATGHTHDYEASGAVATHNSDTTAVHGIANTSLIRGTYVQAGDPGAVGAGYFWLDTSGNLRVRNSADADWIEVVSVD